MTSNSFISSIKAAGFDTSLGHAVECSPECHEYQAGVVGIVYSNGEWSYSFRGCVGTGSNLTLAIFDEQEKYDAAYAAYMGYVA